MAADSGRTARICAFLKTVDLFSELDDVTLRPLAENAVETSYKRSELICRKNLYAHTVYFIRSGTVAEFAVDRNDFSCIAKTRTRADYFGEMGALLGESYTTTVVASTPCVIISVPREPFCDVVWSHHSCIKALLRIYRDRLQHSAEQRISYTMFNAEGRLAYTMLLLHNNQTNDHYVSITQEELSQYCGIARQTASRILSEWKQESLIDTCRGKIAVLDSDALAEILLASAITR